MKRGFAEIDLGWKGARVTKDSPNMFPTIVVNRGPQICVRDAVAEIHPEQGCARNNVFLAKRWAVA